MTEARAIIVVEDSSEDEGASPRRRSSEDEGASPRKRARFDAQSPRAATAPPAAARQTLRVRRAGRPFRDRDRAVDDSDDEAREPAYVSVGARAGPALRVVASADLHQHQHDRYIHVDEGGTVGLVEWLRRGGIAEQVDVIVLAGDLGAEFNEELHEEGVRGAERRATGARVSAREKDEQVLDAWNLMLRELLALNARAHVVLVAGNHDGLLCAQEDCVTCRHCGRFADGDDGRRWGASAAEAARAAVARMTRGLPAGRAHYLCDDAVTIDFGDARGRVRFVGSPWTPGHLTDLYSNHFTRPPGDTAWWRDHWRRVLAPPRDADATTPWVLVTHGPPYNILDLVAEKRHVGDAPLCEALQAAARPPSLHIFGHVHARQSDNEPPVGPRLCAHPRVGGCVFANVAAETKIPKITGFRLSAQQGGQRAGADGAVTRNTTSSWQNNPNFATEVLMRPPTLLDLPVAGFDCGWWRTAVRG